jgi:hypothetical protein
MIELVPARLTHVNPIALNMREIDRIEAEAMGRTPKDALRIGLRCSHSALTALSGGKPFAMLGVLSTNLIAARGAPWLLATDEMFNHGRDLLTIGPRIIGHWLETFSVMENVVATRNHRAIRLLTRWGFSVGGEIQTHRGVDFVPFRIDRASIQGGASLP